MNLRRHVTICTALRQLQESIPDSYRTVAIHPSAKIYLNPAQVPELLTSGKSDEQVELEASFADQVAKHSSLTADFFERYDKRIDRVLMRLRAIEPQRVERQMYQYRLQEPPKPAVTRLDFETELQNVKEAAKAESSVKDIRGDSDKGALLKKVLTSAPLEASPRQVDQSVSVETVQEPAPSPMTFNFGFSFESSFTRRPEELRAKRPKLH